MYTKNIPPHKDCMNRHPHLPCLSIRTDRNSPWLESSCPLQLYVDIHARIYPFELYPHDDTFAVGALWQTCHANPIHHSTTRPLTYAGVAMLGSTALSSNRAPSSSASPNSPSNDLRRKRDFAEVDTIPASPSARWPGTATAQGQEQHNGDHHRSRKQRRVGPAPPTLPRTLPSEPHEELLQELRGRYDIITTSVLSSSKINKKVTTVLAHLGRVDLFSAESRPGVVMLHARAGDASKMVTVMELAKRRMGEAGITWYQYNRVYEVARPARSGGTPRHGGAGRGKLGGGDGQNQTMVEDTVMGGDVNGQGDGDDDNEDDDDDDDAFEPVETPLELAARDKPAAEPKSTYMSVFLSRVPIPELRAKPSITLQTNANEFGNRRKA